MHPLVLAALTRRSDWNAQRPPRLGANAPRCPRKARGLALLLLLAAGRGSEQGRRWAAPFRLRSLASPSLRSSGAASARSASASDWAVLGGHAGLHGPRIERRLSASRLAEGGFLPFLKTAPKRGGPCPREEERMRNRQKPFTPSGRAAHGCRRSPERSDLRSSLNAAFQVRGSRTSLTSRRAMVPCVRSTLPSNPVTSNASARSRRANNPVHPDYGKGGVIGRNPAAWPAGRIGKKCARHRFGLRPSGWPLLAVGPLALRGCS